MHGKLALFNCVLPFVTCTHTWQERTCPVEAAHVKWYGASVVGMIDVRARVHTYVTMALAYVVHTRALTLRVSSLYVYIDANA